LIQGGAVGGWGTSERHLDPIETVASPDRAKRCQKCSIARDCRSCAGAEELRLGRIVLDHGYVPGLGDAIPVRIGIGEGLGIGGRGEKPGVLRACHQGQRGNSEGSHSGVGSVKAEPVRVGLDIVTELAPLPVKVILWLLGPNVIWAACAPDPQRAAKPIAIRSFVLIFSLL